MEGKDVIEAIDNGILPTSESQNSRIHIRVYCAYSHCDALKVLTVADIVDMDESLYQETRKISTSSANSISDSKLVRFTCKVSI
jgi:hypothetical protein